MTLDAEMKHLWKARNGSNKRQAEHLTLEDEEKLWSEKLLEDHSPIALLNTIFYICRVHFALRSAEEHRNLIPNPPQITVYTANDRLLYLLYLEDAKKYNLGGLKQRKVSPKRVNTDNSSRCFVHLFRMYIRKLSTECPSNAFYFKPLQKWSSSGVQYGFQSNPWGTIICTQ